MINKYLFILIFVLILFCGKIFPQENIYITEEIIVSSLRTNTDLLDSPVRTDIFYKNEIQNINGEQLSDILQTSSLVTLKSYGGLSGLKSISISGTGPENTLILLNGIKINNSQNLQFDLSMVTKDNIEKIEILNNGYSAIYGSQGVGGIVNIITNNGKLSDEKFKLNISGQYGSYNYSKFSLNGGKRFGKSVINFNFMNEKSNDNFDYYYYDGSSKILKSRENSDYSNINTTIDYSYLQNSKSKLNLYLQYTDNKRNLPGIETGTPPLKSSQKDRNLNFFTSFNKNFAQLSFTVISIYQNYLMNFEIENQLNNFYRNVNYGLSGVLKYVKNNIDASFGTDISKAVLTSNAFDKNVSRFQVGVFVLAKNYLLDRKLVIFPSLRYDYFSDIKKENISFKIGLNFHLFRKEDIHLKINAGNNFRAPSFNELYWKNTGNEKLNPEKSINFDLGLLYKFNLLFKNLFEISYIYIDLKNKILWKPVTPEIWSPVNYGRAFSNVLNISYKSDKEFTKRLKINLCTGYLYNFTRNADSKSQIIYTPKNTIKVNTGIELFDFGFNIYYQYLSKRFVDDDNLNYLPGIDITDANISYKFGIAKFEISTKIEINNLFNKNYQYISGFPMPLRNYKLILNLNFN
jgi:iron complex outermembrane receptor protein